MSDEIKNKAVEAETLVQEVTAVALPKQTTELAQKGFSGQKTGIDHKFFQSIADATLLSFIPAKCWIAPEMPTAMYRSGATTLPV